VEFCPEQEGLVPGSYATFWPQKPQILKTNPAPQHQHPHYFVLYCWSGLKVNDHCNKEKVIMTRIEVQQTGAVCLSLAPRLFQRLHTPEYLWVLLGSLKICPVFCFSSLVLRSRSKSHVYCPLFTHSKWGLAPCYAAQVGRVLVKAIPYHQDWH
jgi:hypothetical protein